MVNNFDDVIDSRDVIERIEYLKNEWSENTEADPDDFDLMDEDDWAAGLSTDDAHELVSLMELQKEAERTPDWVYGETLIHDDHFTDYTRELLADLGLIPADLPAWIEVDWDATADNVQADYFDVDFDGQTYWVRS